MNPRSLISPLTACIAACAIVPAAASAMPVIEGQSVGAGGGPALKAQDFKQQSIAPAPDQVDRVKSAPANPAPTWPTGPQPVATEPTPSNGAPTWPSNPQPLTPRHTPVTASPSSDGDGLDTGVWIALSGAALIAAGGVGFAGRKRLRLVRRRQLA